jgi:phage-related protein
MYELIKTDVVKSKGKTNGGKKIELTRYFYKGKNGEKLTFSANPHNESEMVCWMGLSNKKGVNAHQEILNLHSKNQKLSFRIL